jgi:hypothetical protein
MAPGQPKPDGLLGLSIAEARLLLLGILCTDEANKVNASFSLIKKLQAYKLNLAGP